MPTVSVPAVRSVAEDGGSVVVCATLSGVPGTTGRDFSVVLATSDGTGNNWSIILLMNHPLFIML